MSLVYFQVEQPIEKEEVTEARFLQVDEIEATGTGSYEGWAGVYKQPATGGWASKLNFDRNINTWGTKNLKTDVTNWANFGSPDATATTDASTW